MAKLQLQLNGNKGLAPNHYGNSLYLKTNPELKYVGSAGQKAEGVYWSERYNGYMSPLPNAYQDCLVIEETTGESSNSAIKMAFTDRKDIETSIVFADNNGLYKAQITPTIDGVAGAFDFTDGYSTPVYSRTHGENHKLFNTFGSNAPLQRMINIDDTYFVSAQLTSLNSGSGTISTYKLENKNLTRIDNVEFQSAGSINNFDFKKINNTTFVIAYQDVVGDDGYIKVYSTNADYTGITIRESITFKVDDQPENISLAMRDEDELGVLFSGDVDNRGYFYRYSYDNVTYQLTFLDETTVALDDVQDTELVALANNMWGMVFYDSTTGVQTSKFKTFGNASGGTITANVDGPSSPNFGTNSMVKISDTRFAIAYDGSGSDGYIDTYDYDGSVFTLIDSLEHDTIQGTHNSFIKLNTSHFVLCYSGDGGDGFIKTFTIDGSGTVSEVDSIEHETTSAIFNSVVKIDDNHIALAYRQSSIGYVKTFNINGSGVITQIDSITHDTTANYNSLVKNDSYYILTYTNSGQNVVVKSFTIDGSYNITEVNNITLSTSSNAYYLDIDKLSDGKLIVVYGDSSLNDGYATTVSIDGAGAFTELSTTMFDSSTSTFNKVVSYGNNRALLTYRDSGNDAHMTTLSINTTTGVISKTQDLQFDTSVGSDVNIMFITSTEVINAYQGGLHSFTLNTETIELDSLELEPVGKTVENPTILDIGSGNYLIKYYGTEQTIRSVSVDSDGLITDNQDFSVDSDRRGFRDNDIVTDGTYVFVPYVKSDTNEQGVYAYDISGTTLSGSVSIPFIDAIRYSCQINIVGSDLVITYVNLNDTQSVVYIENYATLISKIKSGLINEYIKAYGITDVTRSQFAGAISYYYIWGDKIGRASSLTNIGTEIDSANTVEWIYRSNNAASLPKLRSNNPIFVNTKNQYVYVLDGESIHGINISTSGITDDIDGTFDSDLILFQSGVTLMDGVYYNENIYLSMVEGDTNVDLWNLPTDTSTKTNCYIYIWNKVSRQQLQANKIELDDCKHVGKGFAMNGNLYFLTINSANVSEIRALNRGSFTVLHEIGPDNEFTIGKQSVVVTELGAIIATNKGNLFLLDKNNELKKLGVIADDVDGSEPVLVIYGGGEGHEPSNTSQGLHPVVPHLTITYRTTGGVNKIKKFYLRNVGTMLNSYKDFTPSGAQQTWLDANVPALPLMANQGNVYSLVEFLPKLSDLRECVIYCKPTGIVTDGQVTEIAKIHFYKNQQTQPFFTHSVTDKNASRGYLEMNLDTSNANSIQTKVEYNTLLTIGDNDFTPLTGIIEYTPTNSRK